ncbi:uncharacterized protein LOC129911419 [Episyrphus balteatus]|uniref:uncharacterized protein LOC129911419 n=1 Tax=Episyrphus balteatus TaxID=286459 RepID=UPI0024867424|nr:uncharacterized protein LOC129911419 [Episyrphus balteatus]
MMHTANGERVPKEFDKAFFANALQNGLLEQNLEVKKIKFSSGNENTDTYCEQSFRVILTYAKIGEINPNAITVILKLYSNKIGLCDSVTAFNKEKWFFTEILPKFEILLNDIKLFPNCYYVSNTPMPSMVFEDVGRFGFQMANRIGGLDERHARLALKKLGQFHATSMVFAKKRPAMMTNYKQRGIVDPTLLNSSTYFYKTLHRNLGYQIEIISKCEGFEDITKKLKEYHNDFEARTLACRKSRDGEIKVLNHGDLNLDNLLFKYDPQNNPMDLVFIEFQLSIYASLGIDLNYFLFLSVQVEVLKKWNSLLEDYHASLCYTLMELNYSDIPTYEDIEKEFQQNYPYGLFALVGPSTLMNMNNKISDSNNFAKLAKLDERTEEVFMSENLIERLKYSLLEFDKMGVLDTQIH